MRQTMPSKNVNNSDTPALASAAAQVEPSWPEQPNPASSLLFQSDQVKFAKCKKIRQMPRPRKGPGIAVAGLRHEKSVETQPARSPPSRASQVRSAKAHVVSLPRWREWDQIRFSSRQIS